MRKIPTLFKRDPEDMRHVLPEITPGCEWVLAGEGNPTRKYDGTCVMFDGQSWWARREVKPGKPEPDGWLHVDTDETTGKRTGWEPMAQSPFVKFHREALEQRTSGQPPLPGTYELCGPKVNGNPEKFERHVLIEHASAAPVRLMDRALDYDLLRASMVGLAHLGWEGIVWHHPDGRMVKLKVRDF